MDIGGRLVLSLLIIAGFLTGLQCADPNEIKDLSKDDQILLSCNTDWKGEDIKEGNSTLVLRNIDSSIKNYECGSKKITIKIRPCDTCIQVDPGTVAGIVVGDILATVLIAVAVYFIASQQRNRMYMGNKASDRQMLLAHDGNNRLYEPLRERDGGAYSQLAPRGNR
uniref:TYRO protein tyrosine kinase-binding protein n=1 Tax=Erpetoichthys calabaricus TaxID=27687 RepID=A0A8C4XB76_ERPCA